MRFFLACCLVSLFPAIGLAKPNLTPYQPAGWSDKIVVSKVTGNNTDGTGLTTADTLYVDWAVANFGPTSTAAAFRTELYVDNVLRTFWTTNPPLDANFYVGVTDYSIGTLTAGTHTLRIVADSTGVINESNESDNQYTKTITVAGAGGPNLTPYQPVGWSDKIVVSKVTGTSTDGTGLTPTDTLYVDWAVANLGGGPTGAIFTTELYVDNVLRTSWTTNPPLDANFYVSIADYSLGTLAVGTHTLRIVTDSTGVIAEGDESDNQYTKTITIASTSSPTLNTISTNPIPPVKNQQFIFTMGGGGFDPSTVEVFFIGPGCGTPTTCVVPNGVLTTKTTTAVAGPATLADGSFTVQVRNTSTGGVSNTKALFVAAQAGTNAARALVLLVDFPDKPAQVSQSYFQAMMFGNHPPEAPQGSFRDYYKEVSYGTFDVDGSINNATIAWIRLPQNSTYYAGGCYGLGGDPFNLPPPCSATYPQSPQKMIEDAIVAAKNLGLDFGPFDANNDGQVDALFVIHAGRGGEVSQNRNDIWSHKSTTSAPVNTGSTNSAGQTVFAWIYTTEPEYLYTPNDMTMGVFAHEYGHSRWGLPDLYDIDYSSSGIGDWSLMSGGSWNGSPQGASPAHLDAWSKYFVGFVNPTKVTSALLNEPITQAETAPDVYQLLNGSAQTHVGEYFLIENRQRTGFDSGLPSAGLLIWHIDESRGYPENGSENYPGCAGCSGHYKVQLVQADNRWDLEKTSNGSGDAGDPYPGVCGTGACNTAFTDTTAPNSKLWNGQASGVTVTSISASGSTMTATMSPTLPSVPALSISKTHAGNFTQGQQNAQYTVTVSNGAGAAATSGTVTVTETAPSGLTFVSMSGTGWTCNANTCTRSDVLSGGASYPAITVTVNVLANATSPQVNAVSVAGGGSASANTTDSTTVVQLIPDLTITKTHTGNFTQGQTGATYSITVSNSGTGSSSGTVTVTDAIPTGLTATAMSGTGWNCTQPAGPCTRSDVLAASGSYPAITLTVNVAANAPASVTNSATVSGGGETNTGNDTATNPTTIVQLPDLTISKTHTGNFTQGQTGATYSITVSNSGTGPSSGTVTVTDAIPTGLTATAISGTGWSCTQPAGPCTRSDVLAASASYPVITLTVNIAANAPASVTNSATVSGGGETNTGNDTATNPTTIVQLPDLTISKTHTGNFTQGQTGVTYSITVSNSGTGPTSGTVTVTDAIPTGLTATAISGTGWSCTQPAGPCTRSDVLAASGSYPAITLTVNVAANAPASVTNSATVSGGGETNTGNDTATNPTTIVQLPDLTISKTHSGNFTQGQTGATYTITVSNSGAGPTSTTVSVSDTVPAFLTATGIAGTGWTCTQPAGPCTRSDALAASANYPAITLTVSVAANAPASVTNTATVSGGGETNTGNDTASDPTTIVLLPDLTISKTHTGNFTQGQTGATYAITVSNSGAGATSTTVSVSDTVPAFLTATGIAGTGWTCTQPAGPCTRSDALAASASYPAITLTVNVAANAPASVTNTATVSGGGETNTGNDTASDPTTVVSGGGGPTAFLTGYALNGPALRNNWGNYVGMKFTVSSTPLTVTSLGRICIAGNSGTHAIKLVNAGNGTDVAGGTLSLDMAGCTPGQFKYATLPGAVILSANTAYYVASLEVAGGDQWYDTGGVSSTNVAAVNSSVYFDGNWNPFGGPNTSYVPANFQYTTVSGPPDLTITKTHVGNFAQSQTGATYTITVMNSGGLATSTTVSVTDTVPVGLTATGIAGTGWTCTQPAGPCTRSDVLAAGASYPALTLTVNVAANAPASVTNTATVSGGGETDASNDTASDPTTITSGGGGGATAFLTGYALNGPGLRNNWGNYVGMKFTVSSTPLTVTSLGRICIAGNSGTHAIKLVNAGNGTDVAGGTLAVNMAGCTPGQFKYATLAGSVILSANTAYYVASLEVAGGDQWYDSGGVSSTNVAAVNSSVYFDGNWNTFGGSNTSYVPANFQYTTVSGPPDLTITKTHAGNFAQGQTGATYTITVMNSGGLPTSTTVSVSDTVPAFLTATGIAGTGWTCTQPAGPCTRSDVLAAGASYPALTLTVNVAANAPASVTNTAAVSGGGETDTSNDTASDPTTIASGGGGATTFLTGYALNGPGLRNNWGNYVGMKFTVGASPLTVTSLGRICIAGNSGTHTIKLVNASNGTDVAGGTLSLNMAGCTPGQFKYATLPGAVILSANTAYYVASLEVAGGDQWYDSGGVSSTNVAAVNSSVYFDSVNWNPFGGPNTSYVPANFLYQ